MGVVRPDPARIAHSGGKEAFRSGLLHIYHFDVIIFSLYGTSLDVLINGQFGTLKIADFLGICHLSST